MENPCREMTGPGFLGNGIKLGKRFAQKPVDEFLETHVQVRSLAFAESGRNIRF